MAPLSFYLCVAVGVARSVLAHPYNVESSLVCRDICNSGHVPRRTTVFIVPVSARTAVIATTVATTVGTITTTATTTTATTTVAINAPTTNRSVSKALNISVSTTPHYTTTPVRVGQLDGHTMIESPVFGGNTGLPESTTVTMGPVAVESAANEAAGSTAIACAPANDFGTGTKLMFSTSAHLNNVIATSWASSSSPMKSSSANHWDNTTRPVSSTIPVYHPVNSTTGSNGGNTTLITGVGLITVASISCACVCVCTVAVPTETNVSALTQDLDHWAPNLDTLFTAGKEFLGMVFEAIHIAIALKQLEALRHIGGQ